MGLTASRLQPLQGGSLLLIILFILSPLVSLYPSKMILALYAFRTVLMLNLFNDLEKCFVIENVLET